MDSLRWLVDLARRSGVRRIVVNGSFVTDKLEPNDVDCVLLIGPDFPHDTAAEAELLAGLPFINMELVDPRAFQHTERTFVHARDGLVQKGRPNLGREPDRRLTAFAKDDPAPSPKSCVVARVWR